MARKKKTEVDLAPDAASDPDRPRYYDIVDGVRGLSHNDLLRTIDEKIALALLHMDATSLGKANASQLGVLFGILTEKKLLLEGRPTQIYGIQEMKHINDLVPGLLRELGRRGITVDQVPDEPTRMIPAPVTEKDLSFTARSFKPPAEDAILE